MPSNFWNLFWLYVLENLWKVLSHKSGHNDTNKRLSQQRSEFDQNQAKKRQILFALTFKNILKNLKKLKKKNEALFYTPPPGYSPIYYASKNLHPVNAGYLFNV